jgi:hypothetical protein
LETKSNKELSEGGQVLSSPPYYIGTTSVLQLSSSFWESRIKSISSFSLLLSVY